MRCNTFLTVGFVLSTFGIVATAHAACPCDANHPAMNAGTLKNVLKNSTVCAVFGNDKWQEYHAEIGNGSGRIYELSRNTANGGEDVGSWVVSGNGNDPATVTYNYGSGGSYAFQVCGDAAGYDFCGPSPITNAKISAGIANCGF